MSGGRWKKVLAVLAVAGVATAIAAPPAAADQMVNTIDASIDAALEPVTIASGGSTTVSFFMQPSNTVPAGDINGCNSTGSDPATATLSVPAGVTATATSLTFTGCGNTPTTTQSSTFSSSTPGTYTISVSGVTGGKPGSLWDTAPASFQLTVNPPADSTAPVITPVVAGTLGSNDWYTSNVTVTWTVTDPESPVTSTTGCGPTTISTDTTGVTLTCQATSAGGTASNSVTIKRDATAPTITPSLDKTPDPVTGWFNGATGAPTVSFSCSDATSLLAPPGCPGPHTFGEGENQSHSGTVTDNAGNSTTTSVTLLDVDTVNPSISVALDRAPAASGWFNMATGAPVAKFTCSDATSLLAAPGCPADHTFGEGENQTYSASVYDNAGNSDSASVSNVDVDLTAPSISVDLDRDPDPVTGWFNNATGAPVAEFTCSDGPSGVADPPGCPADHTFGEGEDQSHSGTVEDVAGNSSSASVTDVDVDTVAPDVTAELDRDADAVTGWFNAATGAPTLEFECSDATSGLVDPPGCPGDHPFGEGADQSHSETVYDNAGNSATAGASDVDVDTVAPDVTAELDRDPDPVTGWFNNATGAPKVEFTCSDTTSGLVDPPGCPADHSFGQGASQSHSETVYDNAGNSTTAGVSDVDVDTLLPLISVALDRTAAASGWFNETTGAPKAQFTCSDATSLLAAPGCPADHTFGDGEDQSHSGTVSDNAGNSSSASVSNVDVDLTDPAISWLSAITDGASYFFGSVPTPAPTCSASDLLSGPNGCVVTGYDTSVGAHTLTATAHDIAANTEMSLRHYSVLAWTLKGFYAPVDMNGTYNVSKAGSTVPLKFEVFAGPTELTDTGVVDTLTATKINCDSHAVYDTIELTATGGTELRYTGELFIFNWKTPSNGAGKCYRTTVETVDGSTLTALFQLK